MYRDIVIVQSTTLAESSSHRRNQCIPESLDIVFTGAQSVHDWYSQLYRIDKLIHDSSTVKTAYFGLKYTMIFVRIKQLSKVPVQLFS